MFKRRKKREQAARQAELKEALRTGNLPALYRLLADGLVLHAQDQSGYDALIHAAYGQSAAILPVLDFLLAQGVPRSNRSKYGESALSVFSSRARFDGVQRLLDAGADEDFLNWTPLHRVVALGSARDLADALRSQPQADDLETPDHCGRTPFLLALAAGSIDKARLLLDAGASPTVTARCDAPGLFMPITGGHADALAWLLQQTWTEVDQTDEFGSTALHKAIEYDQVECVNLLIDAGANVHHKAIYTPLENATSCPIALRLLDAGADPAHANHRVLLGLGHEDQDHEPNEAPLQAVTKAQFKRAAKPRFGTRNPEPIHEPFWDAMVRAGVTAYRAANHFGTDVFKLGHPTWCAQRFGQSLTLLPDGRAVQIAGEHEDSYDPDFCIYNDVFVHEPDGRISIYAYPEAVFPPTDFHTATLIDDAIVIIGSLGYHDQRAYGTTPVFRLSLRDWRIEPTETHGDNPGWIHQHRAALIAPHTIRIWAGKVLTTKNDKERSADNTQTYTLDLAERRWSKL
ncbi:MAG: ankyrin repeat domain-containing protein [Planctomycetota bacterium]